MYSIHPIGGKPVRWGVFDKDDYLVEHHATKKEAEDAVEKLREAHREVKK